MYRTTYSRLPAPSGPQLRFGPGRAVLVEDRSIVRDRWSEKFRRYFPDGPDNPDTIIVRLHADRIELCVPGLTPEPFGSHHAVIERDGNHIWRVVSNSVPRKGMSMPAE
jgi:hypothetical protein